MNFPTALFELTSLPTLAENARHHRLRRAFEKGRKAHDIRKNPYSSIVSKEEYEQWVEGFNSVHRFATFQDEQKGTP